MYTYYYLIFILIFLVILLLYSFFIKERKFKIDVENEAFNKINIAEGIIGFLGKNGIETGKYEFELGNCKAMYQRKDFIGAKDCSEKLIMDMKNAQFSINFKEEKMNYRICKNCGAKIYGNNIFCPNCGEVL